MNCFESAPEFVDEDNRRFRGRNPVSKQQMFAKHSVLLPESLVRGKTVLDLGCCLGATGHWCLSAGAAHYTGVEVQHGYAELARRLLNRYHPGKFTVHEMAIEKWLAQPGLPKFDVVCLLGVLFVFVDYFSILKLSTALTREVIAIESVHVAEDLGFAGVKFYDDQPVNLATEESSVIGRGTCISPMGLAWLMKEFGFKSQEGLIYPPPITDVPDVYNRPLREIKMDRPVRYLMRFNRQEATRQQSLSENLQRGEGEKIAWNTQTL